MKVDFKARIYKTGINQCVDVPLRITKKMIPEKGYIRIKGTINGFNFIQTLVPVKESNYRLFVNMNMLKGGQAAIGKMANFEIEQNFSKVETLYPMNESLIKQLEENNLLEDFNTISNFGRKDILKYLSYIKTEETLQKNITKLLNKLKNKEKNIRIP